MTEQGAATDNAARDGAPGGAGPFAKGSCVLARRTKPSLANPAKGPIARLLAPPGAPFPRLRGNGKRGRRARPGARIQNHGTAERWLKWNAANQTGDVMSGLSRPKDGVASLAYDPRIHEMERPTMVLRKASGVDRRHGLPGHGAIARRRRASTRVWRRPGNDSKE